MNEITRKIWNSGQTSTGWAKEHGFDPAYVRLVIFGASGKWEVGKAGKIIEALKRDGFWVERPEA